MKQDLVRIREENKNHRNYNYYYWKQKDIVSISIKMFIRLRRIVPAAIKPSCQLKKLWGVYIVALEPIDSFYARVTIADFDILHLI